MSPRSIRRAQEHKARKLAYKAEKAMAMPVAAATAGVQSTSASALDSPVQAISPAQLVANRANSQLSTGPRTATGKQVVSLNAFRHGLAGRFLLLPHENENEFKELFHGLQHEHRPSTPTEHLLVEGMAQHYWLAQRALGLQQACLHESGACEHDEHLALYMRYQTTHDRGFHKCLNDLLKLRAQKRREEIGFVSQQHKHADQTRREANENRKQERHKWAVLLAEAKLEHQTLQNAALDASEKQAAAA